MSNTWGITYSRSYYISKEVKIQKKKKAKGKKAIIILKGLRMDQEEINKLASEKEVMEFLKLIKQNGYSIVD